MKHSSIILLVTVIFFCQGFAQKFINLKTYNVDSLLLVLLGQQAEERINTLNNLAVSLSFVDYQQSKQYVDEAMNLSKELYYEEGIAAAFRNYGQIYVYQGNYPQALNNYFEALALYQKLDETHTAGWICYEIAKTHYFASNYEKTIEYAYMALDIFRKRTDEGTTVGNARDTITIYGGLVETYSWMGMYDKALELNLKTHALSKRNNFPNIELMLTAWSVGFSYSDVDEPDSAKVYFFKALAYPDESLNMKTLKYRNTISLGWLYYSEGKIDSALYYLQNAYEFYEKRGFLYWALSTSWGLGYIYYRNNQLTVAKKYLQKSEHIFNEMLTKESWYRYDSLKHIANYGLELYFPIPPVKLKEMMWGDGRSMYKLLYLLNTKQNKTAEALKYHIAYSKAKDTLYKLQRERETVEIQTRYESDRKDQQIDYLSKENEFKDTQLNQSRIILVGLVGLVILIVILAIVLIRQNKLRNQQQNLILQQKLFRSQMNPHFIFNSLASIQNSIINEEPITASKYLSRFSRLVRNILDSSIEEFITLEEEIATIENYLELQRIRFPEKFDYDLEIDQQLDPESIHIPPMLAQPFIENAIEHGIKHRKTKGHIKVRFAQKDSIVRFELEDDGVGRVEAKRIMREQDKDHRSLSTNITQERIHVLNKKFKNQISLNITDLKDDIGNPTGTMVTFDIPLQS
ncbi:MAG: histidine kinase [Bacteroidales bacterium]|nr:histidine kinase [Bacteroidales bacterium]